MKLFFVDKKSVFGLGFLIVALIICGFCNLMSVATGTDSKEVPIYCVKTDEKKVAITFDSAWGNEDLSQILEALGKYECKATFFVVGDFLNKYAEDVKNMHKNGHEIANHSDTHAHMNSLSREEMIAEMDGCDNKIKNLTGQKEVLFRAPYGEYNNLLVQTCKDTGRFCIQWDCDSLDWKGLTADEIKNRVVKRVKNGSIVLFHNGAEHTAEALPLLLSELKNQGYEFATVSELIYKDNYYIDNAGMQIAK